MVLLSVILKSDCSDCYNYQYRTCCQSLFEEKLDQLSEMYSEQTLQDLLDNSHLPVHTPLEEDFYDLVMNALQTRENRPSFLMFKQQFYGLLRRISISHSSNQAASRIEYLTSARKHKHANPTN